MDTLNFDSKLDFNEFPPVSLEEWEEVIRNDLKGKDYKIALRWAADNDLNVLPFYRKEHLEGSSYPVESAHTQNKWDVIEHIEAADVKDANKQALKALENGASGLSFNLISDDIKSLSDIEQLLSNIQVELIIVYFSPALSTPKIERLFSEWCKNQGLNREKIKAYFCFDPFSLAASTGQLQQKDDIKNQLSLLDYCAIDTSLYGNCGASIIQQLAFALAAGNEIIGFERNLLNNLYFKFISSGTYFPEIAKFRAFRLLWNNILAEYAFEPSPANIHAETALWNKAENDAHNNILRATTETMSAALGGCNSISVLPYNYHFSEPGEFSSRIARNIQLILQEEAYFDKVADPGAGSYYIEVLTKKIAEKSWALFQEIEAKGGFYECLKSGFIQDEIQTSRQEKVQAYKQNEKTLVGVNKYQPDEKIQNLNLKTQNHSFPKLGDNVTEIKKIQLLNLEAELQKGDA